MKSAFLQLTLVVVSAVSALNACSAGSPATPAAPVRVNYARPFEPPTRPAFLPLPPGAIEPAGWLRDWCLAAREGFTGHMDEYDDEFKRAWAPDHKMTGERLLWYKGGWPYEGGGHWFDGLSRLGFALHDEALIQQAKERLDAVADHMNTNGLLFVTGEGRMADRLERAFFNAGPATVSRNFKSHVYFQSPNRFANLSPDFPHGPRAGGGAYQPKHAPLCCTAALNRILDEVFVRPGPSLQI